MNKKLWQQKLKQKWENPHTASAKASAIAQLSLQRTMLREEFTHIPSKHKEASVHE